MADAIRAPFALVLAAGLFAGAAQAQQAVFFPPVPGPYPIAPPAAMMAPGAPQQAGRQGGPVFPSPQALEAPTSQARTAARPGAAPYGEAVPLPYWMQQPSAPAAQAESRPATLTQPQAPSNPATPQSAPTAQVSTRGTAPAAPSASRQIAPASRYGQAGTPGTFPGYMAPRQPGWGYGQPQPQGWGAAPWVAPPRGYGFGPQSPYGRQ